MGYRDRRAVGLEDAATIIVVPLARAVRSSPRSPKAFHELAKCNLLDDEVTDQGLRRAGDRLQPDHLDDSGPEPRFIEAGQRPNTIAKSIAIGNPADGYYAADILPQNRRRLRPKM